MTIAPTYITIDERMKRGLCSPLQIGREAGLWYHHIAGTDVLETVYDPRAGWHLTGGFIKHLTPGPSHVGGYFPPGAPLPQPTGRCQDRADLDAGSDPKNWKFIRMERDSGYEWGVFEWIGPRLQIGYSVMYVPRERMHEMVGARGLGQTPASRDWRPWLGAGLVALTAYMVIGLPGVRANRVKHRRKLTAARRKRWNA